jgi:hypothetical protein
VTEKGGHWKESFPMAKHMSHAELVEAYKEKISAILKRNKLSIV